MFFASTNYNNGKYEVIENARNGVLYKIDYERHHHRINIIGAQGLSRPAKQKAFSMALRSKEDFNVLADSLETIEITRELSEYYYNMFDGGVALMPNDIAVKKANAIMNRRVVTKNSINIYLRNHACKHIENLPTQEVLGIDCRVAGYILYQAKTLFK